MDWDSIAVMVTAAFGVLASWMRVRGTGNRRRDQLSADLDLLEKLPAGSPAYEALSDHVEKAVFALVEDVSERRRDPLGISLAIFFLAMSAVLGAYSWRGGWWWLLLLPVVFFALFGVVGLSEDAVRRKRDERGRSLERKLPRA